MTSLPSQENNSGPGKVKCYTQSGDLAGKFLYIALTGGPGAGKTAVLNLVRETCCCHTEVLRESAGILFGGGFPRKDHLVAKQAAQRAIYHTQFELERLAKEEGEKVLVLCDRGTLDSLAYWPGDPEKFFPEVGSTREKELARYEMVIHLRTPPPETYNNNNNNPLRVESPQEAFEIDKKIEAAWKGHPDRHFIESTDNFLDKARKAIALIVDKLPEGCRKNINI